MSTTEQITITKTKDRVCRIIFEKLVGQPPTMMTVHEDIVDGVSTLTGNMAATYDETNPLDGALYAAMEAKINSMREARYAAANI
jgi:hypothetical protein